MGNLYKFLTKFLRSLESTRRSSWGILMKLEEYCKKILKKFEKNWEENFKWFQENYGNIMTTIKVGIQNWCCCYYKEILGS